MGDESAGDESAGDESAGDGSADEESATIYPHLLKNVSFFLNFIVCQFYLLNADKMAVLPPSLMVLFWKYEHFFLTKIRVKYEQKYE